MNKRIFEICLILLLCAVSFSAAAADAFHSEFGYLPPEFPSGTGALAEKLDGLFLRLEQPSIPPSHRLRTVYEYIMKKYQYDPANTFIADAEQGDEAIAEQLMAMMLNFEGGDADFALLSHYILDRMGFPSVIISGELDLPDGSQKAHQWIYVYYDENWYHFDPLGEMLNPTLNGFMNVQKDLIGNALHWDEEAVPASGPYAIKALGCACQSF